MNKKRVVCFGDSNTWGYNAESDGRFEDDERWTQVMQNELGDAYMIVEEGMSGRTTVFEDPISEGLRGIDALHTVLMSHSPLDLLVIMLGTNDCKERFCATPQNIVDGVERLITKAKILPVWKNSPNILVVAPIIIDENCYHSPVGGRMGRECVEKSRNLPKLMKRCAEETDCQYMDINEFARVNTIDYMHLDLESNRIFGEAITNKVRQLLE